MSRLSFRQRLTLFTAAGIALVLVVGSAATYLVMRSQLRGQVDESLRRQSAAVVIKRIATTRAGVELTKRNLPKQLPGTGKRGSRLQIAAPAPEFGNAPSFFQLVDTNIGATASKGEPLPITRRAIRVAETGQGAYYTDDEVRRTAVRMYVRPAGPGRALIAARSLTDVDNALSRLAWSLAITCLAGIALAALLGAVVARGALRPVRSLTDTAERITDTHDLSQRIETDGDDELSRLGSSFNAMLDSLEGAIHSQRQLVSDASHELRTPLTSLRTNIDLLRQGVALSPGDRERLLRDVTRELEELTTLVANIVELARDLTIVRSEITVRDHGPGVAEADRPYIFDRFYRSEAARSHPGSGLGLAIVRQIAESHGGRVDVEDAEGGGARFRLVLLSSEHRLSSPTTT
jgi:two-component system sensor histidine kinase MprB